MWERFNSATLLARESVNDALFGGKHQWWGLCSAMDAQYTFAAE